MSIHAIVVLTIILVGFIFSFLKHPVWGLFTYVFIYFNPPSPLYNWWANDLPNIRWSFISAVIIVVSAVFHRNKVNRFNPMLLKNYKLLIILLILMFFISPFAVSSEESFLRLYDFFRYSICFVFFVKCLPDMKKFDNLVLLCLACCLFLSLEAYIHPEYRYGGRLEGINTPDSTDSNLIATVFLMTVPFLINEILFHNKYRKVFSLISAVFILNSIVLTGSRGAIVGLISIGVCIILVESNSKRRNKMLVGVFFTMILFVRLLDPTFIDRLTTFSDGEDMTGSGRTKIWSIGLSMAHDFPLGTGGRGFQILSSSYMPDTLLTNGIRSSHNTYLLVLVEQGVVGLILYFFFWASTIQMLHSIRSLIKKFKPEPGSELEKISQYSVATEASIIGLLISGFFVDRLYFELLYWLAGISGFLFFYGKNILSEQENVV